MEPIVLDTQLQPVALLDVYSSFVWADRYVGMSDFELALPFDKALLPVIQEGYYIQQPMSDNTMIIETLAIRTDLDDGPQLLASGRCLKSILDRRIVWGKTISSSNLDYSVRQLLNANILAPLLPERMVPNFVFPASTDSRVLSTIVDDEFFAESLLEAIDRLCDPEMIGSKIVFNDANQFEFSLYSGRDRSYDSLTDSFVVFSPDYENLRNSEYVTSKAGLKNAALIVGEEVDGVNRTATVGNTSGLARREIAVQATDVKSGVEPPTPPPAAYFAILQRRGEAVLDKTALVEGFSGEVDSTQMFVYGQDFFLGDIVQVENEYGLVGTSRVAEVIFSSDASGNLVTPTFISV